MSSRQNNNYRPKILGMEWILGNLILVGSRSWGGRLEYVLGNCIVNGTKDEIPVAIFTPMGDRQYFMRRLLQMQLGYEVFDNGPFSAKDINYFPLYIDDTHQLTIPYLVGQIFRFVEEKGVQLIIINRLQDIDCGIMDEESREGELDETLRLLKALAESLSIVIIVVSRLSRNYIKTGAAPSVRDILDVTEAEKHCDQIILLHPLDPFIENAKMILPLGHPYYEGKYGDLVINVSLHRDKHFFMKVLDPMDEDDSISEDTPMYQWHPGKSIGEWYFEFVDAEGMGWKVSLEDYKESDGDSFCVSVRNWAGDGEDFFDHVRIENLDSRKSFALKMIRKRFPEVEIPDKSEV